MKKWPMKWKKTSWRRKFNWLSQNHHCRVQCKRRSVGLIHRRIWTQSKSTIAKRIKRAILMIGTMRAKRRKRTLNSQSPRSLQSAIRRTRKWTTLWTHIIMMTRFKPNAEPRPRSLSTMAKRRHPSGNTMRKKMRKKAKTYPAMRRSIIRPLCRSLEASCFSAAEEEQNVDIYFQYL